MQKLAGEAECHLDADRVGGQSKGIPRQLADNCLFWLPQPATPNTNFNPQTPPPPSRTSRCTCAQTC